MPSYQLVYFNGKGRGELARLMLTQAGVAFEDTRYEMSEWKDHKKDSPTGQLPYLKIDDYVLPQSHAIARYLAREFDMYGADNMDRSKIDVVLDTLDDFVNLCVKVRFASDDTSKESAKKTLLERAPIFVAMFVKMLKDNGDDFIVGSKVSAADFALQHYLTLFPQMEVLSDVRPIVDVESLIAHRERITALPKIAPYIASRAETAF